MNTKNVHVIREPTITKIVMLFSILMCILLYKPITAEATSADCDKGYGIPSPSTMVDLATGKGAYWSSGGSWQSWIDFYKSMGYTYTGYSDCYMLYGANSSGHQTNEYVHGYWMDLTKNGQTYWAILRNDFGDTNTYYSRYNSWHCVNETLNGVNEYTWYYTNGIGIVYTNTWLHTRTHDPHPNKSDIHGYFCFNASGRMSVGWHKGTDGKWYYFRIDTVRGEDGANTRTGMSKHGGLIWNTVHSPTTYGTNGLYSEGLYLFEGLDVATNVYRRNTNGTFDYVGTDVTRINAGSNSNQIEPFRSKKISSNTKYVNDQIYNTNALYINTNVAGTYTADQNVLLVNDDYQHIRVNEYTYYIDRKKFTLTQNINSDTETTKTSTIYYEGTQNIPTPTKTGYKFDGWEVSGNGSKMDGNTFTMGDADATITAKWTPIDYTISYDLQGGTINGQPTKYTIESPTLNIPRPIKTGYTFLGWTGSNGNKNQLDVSITHGKGTAYNNNQMIGNKFFIDNLGKDVLLDGKSHDVTLYAQWKDITVPDIKEVTAEQETLLSKVNSGQLTLTSQSGAYNGELYTNLKIKIDENNANKDASGIKNVSVLVYDKNNTTVQKTYDITNNISYGTNTKYDFGYDGKYYPYSGTYTFKVNLYKEFPNASKLGIYVYCTDAQGNTTKRNDIFTRPSVDIPQDKPIVIPDKPIEGIVIDEINECIYSQYVTVEGSKDFGVGETGITTTWTYGYVERYDLDYREINTEMENEIANNLLSADNRMNRSHEIGRDSNGKAPLASVDNQIVRIPPYVLQHLSTPDTTKHNDGTTKYKDLLNNKYTATGYKGTQETGIYNIYNIKDTEYQDVHYRSGV